MDNTLPATEASGGNIYNISARLSAIIEMAECMARELPGTVTVADVGCDHGYVSAEIIRRNIADRVIASDVRPGPLAKAKEISGSPELAGRMETRLSDGLKGYAPGEADIVIMAGMGGRLMLKLLSETDIHELGVRGMILQPQSELMEVRRKLRESGLDITDERMLTDNGKTYMILSVTVATGTVRYEQDDSELMRVYDRYGRILLERRDPVLRSYLEHRREVLTAIIDNMTDSISPVSKAMELKNEGSGYNLRTYGRFLELQQELEDTEKALHLAYAGKEKI